MVNRFVFHSVSWGFGMLAALVVFYGWLVSHPGFMVNVAVSIARYFV